MTTNLSVDSKLIDLALEISGERTKKAVVMHEVLCAYAIGKLVLCGLSLAQQVRLRAWFTALWQFLDCRAPWQTASRAFRPFLGKIIRSPHHSRWCAGMWSRLTR